MPETTGQPIVVTTEHRGVFFGYLAAGADRTLKVLELAEAQMCVYWSSDVRGILGLAATGPAAGSKVTRPVPRMTLQGVTSVIDVTPEAVALWQGRPWS